MMQHIALLSSRAAQSFKRDESSKIATVRKIDAMYPDKVLRQVKAAQEEKLIEARAKYWSLEERNALVDKVCIAFEAPYEKPEIEFLWSRGTATQVTDTSESKRPAAVKNAAQEPAMIAESIKRSTAPAKIAHSEAQRLDAAQFLAAQFLERKPLVSQPRGDRQNTQQRHRVTGTQNQAMIPQQKRIESRYEVSEHVSMSPDMLRGEAQEMDETPAKKLIRLSDTIKKLESEAKYEELIRAWVEYGACVRMEHSDTHPLLVRTHFSIATNYLRQKLVVQALQHFKASEEINSCNDCDKDKEAANFRCR